LCQTYHSLGASRFGTDHDFIHACRHGPRAYRGSRAPALPVSTTELIFCWNGRVKYYLGSELYLWIYRGILELRCYLLNRYFLLMGYSLFSAWICYDKYQHIRSVTLRTYSLLRWCRCDQSRQSVHYHLKSASPYQALAYLLGTVHGQASLIQMATF
jgi:hypothetical protein